MMPFPHRTVWLLVHLQYIHMYLFTLWADLMMADDDDDDDLFLSYQIPSQKKVLGLTPSLCFLQQFKNMQDTLNCLDV